MREIVFDTESTGLDPATGDRIVEIGCIELVNHIPSGEKFHRYVNPQRSVPSEAVRVHGLDDAFLADKPLFADIAEDLLAFLDDAILIAHNAAFDQRFLNAELTTIARPIIPDERMVDTLALARRRFPGSPASLDALCRRFQIDASHRTLHGALLDAELLAEVYIELIGGRQAALVLGEAAAAPTVRLARSGPAVEPRPVPRMFRIEDHERAAHRGAVDGLGSDAIWRRYLVRDSGSAADSAPDSAPEPG
ncbi:MAG: DNA polymerase III subunit epsilon [Alphaproteobacteria bacterium]